MHTDDALTAVRELTGVPYTIRYKDDEHRSHFKASKPSEEGPTPAPARVSPVDRIRYHIATH
jgi:hypothetical protein